MRYADPLIEKDAGFTARRRIDHDLPDRRRQCNVVQVYGDPDQGVIVAPIPNVPAVADRAGQEGPGGDVRLPFIRRCSGLASPRSPERCCVYSAEPIIGSASYKAHARLGASNALARRLVADGTAVDRHVLYRPVTELLAIIAPIFVEAARWR